MRSPIKISVKFLKESLGGPTGYLWSKCLAELGYPKRLRYLTILQAKIIMGWFCLYAQHRDERDRDRSLIVYYAASATESRAVVPAMSGKDILALKDRPSNATLYRRGLRHNGTYSPKQIEDLIR